MTAIIIALALIFAQTPAERKARLNDMILEGPSTRTIEKGDQMLTRSGPMQRCPRTCRYRVILIRSL